MKTNNYIYRQGDSPETRVAVSQKNRIYSKHEGSASGAWAQVGATSTFDVSESRALEPIRGVGYGDQIAEMVPGVTEPMSITINRYLLYLASIHQVFGYKGSSAGLVRSLKHHRWPFDIKQELVMGAIASHDIEDVGVPIYDGVKPDATNNFQALFTFYEACWMESWDSSFPADTAQVAENVTAKATDVIDGFSSYGIAMDTGNNPFDDSTGSFRFGDAGTVQPSTPLNV